MRVVIQRVSHASVTIEGVCKSAIKQKSLLQAVDTAVELCKDGQHGIPVPDYVDENVSTKVVKIVQSYVSIVNKMVWRRF